MDRILESWRDDQPVVHDESNCDFITRATLSEMSRLWKLKLHGLQGVNKENFFCFFFFRFFLIQKYEKVPSKYLVESDELEHQYHCFLRMTIIQGDGSGVHTQYTKTSVAAQNLRWDQWIFLCPVNQLARGARLSISVHALFAMDAPQTIDDDICSNSERLGWVNIPMFDQYGVLIGGNDTIGYQLWVGDEQVKQTKTKSFFEINAK
jgi:hypothetical protein